MHICHVHIPERQAREKQGAPNHTTAAYGEGPRKMHLTPTICRARTPTTFRSRLPCSEIVHGGDSVLTPSASLCLSAIVGRQRASRDPLRISISQGRESPTYSSSRPREGNSHGQRKANSPSLVFRVCAVRVRSSFGGPETYWIAYLLSRPLEWQGAARFARKRPQ